MKVFISWSGDVSKEIAIELREWLPLLNEKIEPYVSVEDLDKGTHWSGRLRQELSVTSFGILVLTPENTESTWLHFEAGAIAKSVEEGRLAPILFDLKPSDIKQPFSLFQTTEFEPKEMLRLMQSLNRACPPEEARDDRRLELVFDQFWPRLFEQIKAKLAQLRSKPPKTQSDKQAADEILQELLVLTRRQARVLANPGELFGNELLVLLSRLVSDAEAAAVRLAADERQLVMALGARWKSLERNLRLVVGSVPAAETLSQIGSFSRYLKELVERVGQRRP